MNECFCVEEIAPVTLTLCDIPSHFLTFMAGFVRLISHGSLGPLSLGPGLQLGRLSPSWGGESPGRLCFKQLRFFHLPSEQSFEKEGEFLEPWKIFNETIFPRLGDEILFSFCFIRTQLCLYNFMRAGCSGRPALSGLVNKLQGRNRERYLSSS